MLKNSFLYIALFIISFGNAQRYFHDFDYHDFIKYDENKITFKGDSTIFEPVYEKLDRILFEGKGQLNFMHIGGSHVQAGIWSGAMRNNLQSLYPNIVAGRGLVFPYRAGKTTNPHDYHVRYKGYWKGCRNVERKKACLLGLMGIKIETSDSTAWIKIADRIGHEKKYSFTRATIFHNTDSSAYSFHFPNDTNAVISTFPEKGYSVVEFSKSMDTLDLKLQKTHSKQHHFINYGMRLETDQPGIYYDAIGNNGAAIPAYLRCNLLEQHLTACPPDVVILAIGINDAYGPASSFSKEVYKSNYRELIKRIKTVSPNTVILFTTNNDSYYKKRYVNKNGVKVKEAMEELSKEMNAAIWDMFSIMGGLGSIDKWVYSGIAKSDRIHFNRDGYKLLGNMYSSAFIQLYDQHLKLKYKQ